ncbi:ribonuclease HI family protein [Candidatus Woesearchaeota archaeon]|nr:ribonuclease HI family protein [Candidatus Woesearchaeota archaeon]
MKKITIFTDGACKGNPGQMFIGAVIYDEYRKAIKEISMKLGRGTCNEAEYCAIIAALKYAKSIGAEEIMLRSDSMLLVKQIRGKYQVKAENLIPLYDEVFELKNTFNKFKVKWIPRENNEIANYLANGYMGKKWK